MAPGTNQDSFLCQEAEPWLRIEDKPSRQPLAGPIRLTGWCPQREATAEASSPPRPWGGPATECRQRAIDFGSLSPIPGTHQLPTHRGPFRGGILPSALTAEPHVLIQAQMEDKGVGLIDQAAPAPM